MIRVDLHITFLELFKGDLMKRLKADVKRIVEIFSPFKKHFVIILLFLAVVEFLALASPYLLGKLVNGLQAKLPTRDLIVLGGLMLVGWFTELLVMTWKDVYEFKHIAWNVSNHLSDLTLRKILELSIGQHRSQNSGLTQSVISQGQNALRELVWLTLFTVLPLAVRLVVVTIAISLTNGIAGMIVIVGIILYGFLSFFEQKKTYPSIKKLNDKNHKANKNFSEILRNTSLIQVNSQEKRIVKEQSGKMDDILSTAQGVWIPYIHRNIPRYALPYIIRFFVLMLGIYSVSYGKRPFGDLVVLVYWTNQVTSELWFIGRLQRQWIELSANIKKYFAILDIQPTVSIVANPISPQKFRGRIEFSDVAFTYPTTRYIEEDKKGDEVAPELEQKNGPALKGLSFVIEEGQSVAFVGPSGAGKSTIISLLFRGYDPDSGQILIDNHDLRLIDLKKFREQTGLVEQSVKLMDKTLRYNILFGLNGRGEDVTDDMLDEVSKASAIDQFRHRLTKGWDTRIGENGVELSGGECQRVGIARALIKDPSILILDEATSSLDAVNEHLIKNAVKKASEGRTTIIIAHRLSTVRDVDKIFVVNGGSVVAEGRHNDLYQTSEIYRELVEKQLFTV